MNIKSIAAAVLAATSVSAFAVGPGPLGTIDNMTILIDKQVVPSGVFQHVYSFTLADPGTLEGIFGSVNILGISFTLQDASFAVIRSDSTPPDNFTFTGLAAGNYALNVLGFSDGNTTGQYSGALIATTAPVPEPQTYALMLAGLAAVGFAASRSKSKA